MKVQKIKDNAMRKVAEAPIIHDQSLSRIDHLVMLEDIATGRLAYFDVIQILLLHRLELRDSRRDARQIMLHCIF